MGYGYSTYLLDLFHGVGVRIKSLYWAKGCQGTPLAPLPAPTKSNLLLAGSRVVPAVWLRFDHVRGITKGCVPLCTMTTRFLRRTERVNSRRFQLCNHKLELSVGNGVMLSTGPRHSEWATVQRIPIATADLSVLGSSLD